LYLDHFSIEYDAAGNLTFISRDPAKDGIGWYVYSANNPTTHTDPSGKFINLGAAVVGAAIGAGAGFLGSIISDKIAGRDIDWKGAGISAAVGAGTGALAGLTFGASLAVTGAATGAKAVLTNVAVQASKNLATKAVTNAVISTARSVIEQGLRYGKVDAVQTGTVAGISALPFGIAKLLPASVKEAIAKFGSSVGARLSGGLKTVISKFFKGGCTASSSPTIMPYNELKKITAGTGFESHHLLEKRFASKFNLKEGEILSTPLDPTSHQGVTNAMRNEIGYTGSKSQLTTTQATPQQIWEATVRVYKQME